MNTLLYPTRSGVQPVDVLSYLMENRMVFLTGDIEENKANEIIQQVMALSLLDPEKPITILINSNGGESRSGLMLYDMIRNSRTPIHTCCISKAFSMAAILLAASPYRRTVFPSAQIMLHEPWTANSKPVNALSVQSLQKQLTDARKQIIGIIAECTHGEEEEIARDIQYDHYFSAQEALRYGLCDQIVTYSQLLEEIQ